MLSEFEDRELLKAFGGGGLAAFPGTGLIEGEVRSQFGVERVGWCRGVRETYYAIAVQRRAMHPVVQRLFTRVTGAPQAPPGGGGRADRHRPKVRSAGA